ncbi:restriction endonuclease [Burkholderia anthina]|uniref:restriction endonuclease n=1 Tax=Burkholderia anthina TaxID=179879 RepID=UPI0018C71433|nr:restriction endonuclease [Burkholderia anthina]
MAFVEKYLADDGQRARLISAPGMGKTTVALHTGHELLRLQRNRNMLVISPHRIHTHHWRLVGEERGVVYVDGAEHLRETSGSGICVSARDVLHSEMGTSLLELSEAASLFIVVDDVYAAEPSLIDFVECLLAANTRSRSLALLQYPGDANPSNRWDEFTGSEYFFEPRSILLPESRLEIARLSPSYSVLNSLLARSCNVDDLHWRQFEKLIAELLEEDGYEVELMEGTKDGGVDVVAFKDLGPLGLFKTVWQAKKKQTNKVGLSVVRELADTRDEFGASKAFIVTSTFLTRGAAQRIQRDRYQLGKVDRDDLNAWIDKIRSAQ